MLFLSFINYCQIRFKREFTPKVKILRMNNTIISRMLGLETKKMNHSLSEQKTENYFYSTAIVNINSLFLGLFIHYQLIIFFILKMNLINKFKINEK